MPHTLIYRLFMVSCVLPMLFMTFHATAQSDSSLELDFELLDDLDFDDAHYFTHDAMGTEFTFMVRLREGDVGRDDLRPAVQLAFDEIDSLERQISSWIPTSDTSQVNKFGDEVPVEVRGTAFELFEFCVLTYSETEGVFDITIGPLIDVRRNAKKHKRNVTRAEVATTLVHIGMDKVQLNPKKKTVAFKTKGMRVSFGGIGKGLALDRAAKVLKTYGIENALLNGGRSSIIALGTPKGKDFWKIGIHNPYNENSSLDVINLRDQALSTSACYRELSMEGDAPCGIYDPRTGRLATGLWSATVVAQSGMQTDALSTAFYVLGEDGVRKYCAEHPEVYAVLVPANGERGEVPQPIRIGNNSSVK